MGPFMVRTMRVPRLLVAVFVICLCHQGVCDASGKENCDDPCGKPTPWENFNSFELRVTVPGKPGSQFWRGRFDKESDDIQIDVESTDGHEATKGRILLVGGRVMAIQGPIAEAGYEIDALDAPVLYQKLVIRLLGEAFPDGPARMIGGRSVDVKNARTGIQFATPSAQGFIQAPWHLTGRVNALSPNNVRYELALTAAGPASESSRKYVANFEGRLSNITTARIDDHMQLDGWQVLGLGVQTRQEVHGKVFDYGAAPTGARYKEVADIRKKIAVDNYPGEPDPSKNFTGFWKQNCDEAFGLQIMPYGKDGRYSVIFCGPGGCGTPGEEGKNTFITKDPDYIVISDSELKIRNADSDWDAYLRCTTDPHPVLKYKQQ
jgi:hypothetical protein